MLRPARTIVRREAGIYALERALQRRGFRYVAGADEAGRGACAGPLVAAAAMLPEGRRGEIDELADSKLLTPAARERVYAQVVRRALAYAVVVIPSTEVDERGLHVCNVAALRRAVASLAVRPDYVLTDGFRVDGIGAPGLAVWKGDQVAACVAAASVLAKVTRDRIMVDLDGDHPEYGFAEHKGYVTPEHAAALDRHGPCGQHRFSYVNVAAALAGLAESIGGAELAESILGAGLGRQAVGGDAAEHGVLDGGGGAGLGRQAVGGDAAEHGVLDGGTVGVALRGAEPPLAPVGEDLSRAAGAGRASRAGPTRAGRGKAKGGVR